VVLAALGKMQVDRAKNVVEATPDITSFQRLREALISSHTLIPFKQVDKIVIMDQLNGRKPTELLTEMEKFRPADDHHFFAYHFLQRMLREVRILLARDDCKDMHALAEKADSLMAVHLPQQAPVRRRRAGSRSGQEQKETGQEEGQKQFQKKSSTFWQGMIARTCESWLRRLTA
jgi:hypothetical protein